MMPGRGPVHPGGALTLRRHSSQDGFQCGQARHAALLPRTQDWRWLKLEYKKLIYTWYFCHFVNLNIFSNIENICIKECAFCCKEVLRLYAEQPVHGPGDGARLQDLGGEDEGGAVGGRQQGQQEHHLAARRINTRAEKEVLEVFTVMETAHTKVEMKLGVADTKKIIRGGWL